MNNLEFFSYIFMILFYKEKNISLLLLIFLELNEYYLVNKRLIIYYKEIF